MNLTKNILKLVRKKKTPATSPCFHSVRAEYKAKTLTPELRAYQTKGVFGFFCVKIKTPPTLVSNIQDANNFQFPFFCGN